MGRTRLDAVVQLRERAEDKAAHELGKAEAALKMAEQRAHEARKKALSDPRTRHDVAQWEMMELAHHRALAEAKRAAEQVEKMTASTAQVRKNYVVAYQRAEVVRRVAEARRVEHRHEAERAETKMLDEVGAMLFVRKVG